MFLCNLIFLLIHYFQFCVLVLVFLDGFTHMCMFIARNLIVHIYDLYRWSRRLLNSLLSLKDPAFLCAVWFNDFHYCAVYCCRNIPQIIFHSFMLCLVFDLLTVLLQAFSYKSPGVHGQSVSGVAPWGMGLLRRRACVPYGLTR